MRAGGVGGPGTPTHICYAWSFAAQEFMCEYVKLVCKVGRRVVHVVHGRLVFSHAGFCLFVLICCGFLHRGPRNSVALLFLAIVLLIEAFFARGCSLPFRPLLYDMLPLAVLSCSPLSGATSPVLLYFAAVYTIA